MKITTHALLFCSIFNLISSRAQALNLNEYMQLVKKNNKVFVGLNSSLDAADDKLKGGDVVLAPVLTAGYSVAVDKSLPSTFGTRREDTQYSLGLAKKFTTGTSLSLNAKTDQFLNDGIPAPVDQFSTGGVGLSLSQSLWKDFFGKGTRLRQSREMAVNQFEKLRIDLQIRLTTSDAESVFWDYAFAQDDLKLKKSNLERAQRLEKWTSNRVSNGISDRGDLMNVKALAALREVQYLSAEDEIKTQETKLREYMGLIDSQPTPEVNENATLFRDEVNQLFKSKKNIIKIDSYLASLEAQTKQLVAEEIKDSQRPDLALVASYTTSAYNREYSQVTQNIGSTDRPKTYIGVNFNWAFDTESKSAFVSAAIKDALASQYIAERNLVLGKNAWTDLIRKYEITKQNVMTLEKVAQFQRERAKAEQDKFNKGRTVTANVVTAETEAAEAEVNLLRVKSGLRKLESSSLLFIVL